MAVVCRLYEMLYPCICNVVISCWKSGAYGYVICRGGTDMCFVPGSGWKHLDLKQYRISGLTRWVLMDAHASLALAFAASMPCISGGVELISTSIACMSSLLETASCSIGYHRFAACCLHSMINA